MTSTTIIPDCMYNAPKSDPHFRDLSREELSVASKELTDTSFLNLKFPRTRKLRVDSVVPQQNFFVCAFTPSKDARPDLDGCYGTLKFRGAYNTETEAKERSEFLVKNEDRFNENLIGIVGTEFPLSNESKYCSKIDEVDIRSIIDRVQKDHLKSEKDKDKNEIKEIEDKQRELLEDVKKDHSELEDMEYYITQKQKLASARILIEECQKKEKIASKVLRSCKTIINELDEKYPQYKKEYQKEYTSKLADIGLGVDKTVLERME